MKRPLFAILIATGILLAHLPARADDGGTESVFHIGAGARAMAMGNAYVGLADDATAIYYNPAGLARLTSQQLSFLHTILFEGTVFDYISYAYPLGQPGALGIAGMRIGTDDIGRRDETHDLGRFGASQMQILLSYGRRIDQRYLAGASLKLAHQSIDDWSAYGYGLDLAGQMQIREDLQAGLRLQDIIGARLKLAQTRERTPFTLSGGVAYLYHPVDSKFSGVATLDLDKPEYRSFKIRAGVEVTHVTGLSLRGGFDRDNLALGMGLRYQRLQVDYAYRFIDHLTDSHRFSLTYSFGVSEKEKAARQTEAERHRQQQALSESRRTSFTGELDRADRYYAAGQYDSALAAYYRADAFAEDKTYVQGRIAELQQKLGVSADTSSAVLAMGFERQARQLFAGGALVAARDMAAIARRYQVESASLDTLEQAIQQALQKEIWTGLAKAESAFSLGDFIGAYDNYNSVLMLDPGNKKALDGSQRAEKSLDLAQKLNLALDYYNQGRFISAQREFNAVMALEPGNKTAAEYLDRINGHIKASTSLEDLQKDARIWKLYLDGLEAFRQGDYEKAITFWENVLEVYPNNENTIENIKQARLRLKK